MKQSVEIQPNGTRINITIPQMRTTYLEKVMRSDSFIPLLDLFKRAHAPSKEFTESYAALHHLKKMIIFKNPNYRVIHIGDGSHARTAALFAFLSRTNNISVDPAADEKVILPWMKKWGVQRFSFISKKIEDAIEELSRDDVPTILTFVHAHVDTDWVLDRMKWDAAFVMPCCKPKSQLSQKSKNIIFDGLDWAVFSPQRQIQVLKKGE